MAHSEKPELRAEIRRTLDLAWPVVLTQLSLMSMSFVDTLMIGPLGPLELGAVQLARSSYYTIVLVAMGCIAGIEPIIGQAYGAARRERCGEALWQAFWIALGLGLPLTVLFLDFRWALRLGGQDEALTEAAHSYLAARAPGVVPFLLFAAQRGFLNSVGKPRAVLTVAVVANLVNAGLNWLLIYGNLGFPRLGLEGAGIATSIGQTVMALQMAWIVFRSGRFEGHGLARAIGPRWAELRRIFALGLPVGLQIGAEVGVFAAAAFLMGRLGAAPLAAHTVALTLASATFMVPLGCGVAASARVSQLIGAGDPERALYAGRVAMGLGAGFMTISAIAFMAVPATFVRFFNDDVAVVAVGVWLVRIAGLFQVSDGLQAVAAGCLRGAADTRTPMWANLIAHWGLGLPLAWVLAVHTPLGPPGVWLGLTGSLTVVAAVLVLRFTRGRWRALGPVAARERL